MRRVAQGQALWIVLPEAAAVRLWLDEASTPADQATAACGLGLHGLWLDAARLAGHSRLQFSWQGRCDLPMPEMVHIALPG